MNIIECCNLTKNYKNKTALNSFNLNINENVITGLVGRNGAGKSTLLKIIAGFIKETSGQVKVFSQKPYNNLNISSNIIFIDEKMDFYNTLNLSEILRIASTFYKNWNMVMANKFLEYFMLDKTQNYKNLSKGSKSLFNGIIGISARCPLTIMDEPTSGMDIPSRKDFYRALLKDYIEYPRTILLSSHHLNEIENLIEDILIIRNGENNYHGSIIDLKEYLIGLRGKKEIIDTICFKKLILHQNNIDKDTTFIVMKNDLNNNILNDFKIQGVEITHISADNAYIYMTENSNIERRIDNVFNN